MISKGGPQVYDYPCHSSVTGRQTWDLSGIIQMAFIPADTKDVITKVYVYSQICIDVSPKFGLSQGRTAEQTANKVLEF